MNVRVLLVDDQQLIRLGFRMVLESHDDVTVVGEAGDGVQALRLVAELAPDVVLMDVRMPLMDGIEATRRMVAAHPGSRVLLLTTFDLDEYAYAGLRAGASGFMLKDVPPDQLVTAIRVVAAGDAVVAPAVTRRLLDAFADRLPDPTGPAVDPAVEHRLDRLTDREREVMVHVAAGRSNAEIAGRLVLSEATVKTHVGRILHKLDLRDRVQVVVLAYETGVVRPPR